MATVATLQDDSGIARGLNAGNLLHNDPPVHAKLRHVAIDIVGDRMRQILEGATAEAGSIVGSLQARPRFDVVADLAMPYTVRIIAQIMGLPTDELGWLVERSYAAARGNPDLDTTSSTLSAARAMTDIMRYVADLTKRRASDLPPGAVRDLLDTKCELLSESELRGIISLLFIAGHENSVNQIANSIRALLTHPPEAARLAAADALAPNAVRELLRYDSPVLTIERHTTKDVFLDGYRIPANSHVIALVGAANRDPSVYKDPDALDVSRVLATTPLSFGAGIHHCLGYGLARIEAEVLLPQLLRAMPNVALAEQSVSYIDSNSLRGPQRLILVNPEY